MPAAALRAPLVRARLGRLADDKVAALAAAGDERAFEELYDRHHAALLGFCRHMLGTREEGEDALQQTFMRAHRALLAHGAPDDVRPWLFAIARNRCRSIHAARKDAATAGEDAEPVTEGLSAGLEQRADLRALLADIGELPEDQRSALVLAELADMPHAEIGAVIGVPANKVKALVHQARTHLIAERDARETPCEQIREQLANARGGELRRGPLRRHLNRCEPCSAYRRAVSEQRVALGLILPVIPSVALKDTILGAIGGGGGGGAAAVAAGGAAGAASAGSAGAGAAGSLGLGAKLAVGAALLGTAGGGAVVAEKAIVDKPVPVAAAATAHPASAKTTHDASARPEHASGPSDQAVSTRDGARGDVASKGKRRAHAYGKSKNASKGRRSHGSGSSRPGGNGKSHAKAKSGGSGKALGRTGAGSQGAIRKAAAQQRKAAKLDQRAQRQSPSVVTKPATPPKKTTTNVKPPQAAVPVKQKPAAVPTATPLPVPAPTAVATPKNTGQAKKGSAGADAAQP